MERLKNIAIIVGLLLSMITLYNWGAKLFSHDVIARLQPGAFRIPPQLDAFYSKLAADLKGDTFSARVLANDSFKNAYALKDLSDDARTSLVDRIAGMLPSASDISIPFPFTQIETCWTGTVTNSSRGRITSVQLYLSGAKFALLQRDNNSKDSQTVANLINIGDLRPGESVDLSVWSGSGFKYIDSRDVRLTHSGGIGQIIIPRPVTGLPALIDKFDFIVYMLLFWLFVALVVPMAINRLSKWRYRRKRI